MFLDVVNGQWWRLMEPKAFLHAPLKSEKFRKFSNNVLISMNFWGRFDFGWVYGESELIGPGSHWAHISNLSRCCSGGNVLNLNGTVDTVMKSAKYLRWCHPFNDDINIYQIPRFARLPVISPLKTKFYWWSDVWAALCFQPALFPKSVYMFGTQLTLLYK